MPQPFGQHYFRSWLNSTCNVSCASQHAALASASEMAAPRKALELGRDIAVGGTLCTVGDGAAQYAFTDTLRYPG